MYSAVVVYTRTYIYMQLRDAMFRQSSFFLCSSYKATAAVYTHTAQDTHLYIAGMMYTYSNAHMYNKHQSGQEQEAASACTALLYHTIKRALNIVRHLFYFIVRTVSFVCTKYRR